MEKIELRRLANVHRTLASAFLICIALAYGVALLFVFVKTDMHPTGIANQYRGTPELTASSFPESEPSSPALEEEEAAPTSLKDDWRTRNHGMKFPKSLQDMILTTHLHMLSISLILFLLGGIFSFSSFPEKAKAWVIITGFVGLAATYGSMWGLRYGSPNFSYGVFLFGTLQAVAIGTQMSVSLRDLLVYRSRD